MLDKTAGAGRLRAIGSATLRANRAFKYVQASSLNHWGWRNDAATGVVYAGALRPLTDSWLGTRAVDALAADIFVSLRKPSPLPRRLRRRLGVNASAAIAQLVLDGVLEIERPGGFAFGADAYDALFTAPPSAGSVQSATAALSRAALDYAATLDTDDVTVLSDRLYCYNRIPASPSWLRRLPSVDAAARFLGIAPGSALRAVLDRSWESGGTSQSSDSWTYWLPRDGPEDSSQGGHVFKLFVSPAPRHAPRALHITIEILATHDAPSFKHGCGAYSLLRPDKIVAYFPSFERLSAAATELARALHGVEPHGVPFSAQFGDNGLLSWGIDPPRTHQPLEWQDADSWRTWATSRLARSLIVARHAQAPTVPAPVVALDRIALEGVDIATWTPQVMYATPVRRPDADHRRLRPRA